MDEKKSAVKEFFRLVTLSFTCGILIVSIVGTFFGDDAREIASMFELGSAGLQYHIIFSFVLLCMANSFLALLITHIFRKLLLLWQVIITMFVCLVANGIIIAAFRWIPLDSWRVWLSFVGTFVGIFTIFAIVMVVQTKRADKRYEKQLSEYKAKQKNMEENV
jgi:magnesium-transporting ATPase (P-type)